MCHARRDEASKPIPPTFCAPRIAARISRTYHRPELLLLRQPSIQESRVTLGPGAAKQSLPHHIAVASSLPSNYWLLSPHERHRRPSRGRSAGLPPAESVAHGPLLQVAASELQPPPPPPPHLAPNHRHQPAFSWQTHRPMAAVSARSPRAAATAACSTAALHSDRGAGLQPAIAVALGPPSPDHSIWHVSPPVLAVCALASRPPMQCLVCSPLPLASFELPLLPVASTGRRLHRTTLASSLRPS